MENRAVENLKRNFNLSIEELLDKSKIKIINGIAGCGKSSVIDACLPKGYARLTSTNRLKADAIKRYGNKCNHYTIAGGMFKNQNRKFYVSGKEVKEENIVIDEILQTNSKVIAAAKQMTEIKNIIILTDDRQLIGRSSTVLMDFDKLRKDKNVIYRTCDKTLRATTNQTKAIYEFLYFSVNHGFRAFEYIKPDLPVLQYSNLKYNKDDVYICHTNEIEEILYIDFNLSERYDAPLIKKAGLASKDPKDLSRYPILSQMQAEKIKSQRYLQLANVGTAHRYQGSEVNETQNLYYLISYRSKISNREIYTVATRCKDIRSLKLVYINDKLVTFIKQFNGLPVKQYKIKILTGNEILLGGKTLKQRDQECIGKKILVRYQDIQRIQQQVDFCDENVSYDRNIFWYNERIVCQGQGDPDAEMQNILPPDNRPNIYSILKKDPDICVSYIPIVYKIMDDIKVDCIKCLNPVAKKEEKNYDYEIDLMAAFPEILSKFKVPVSGRLSQIRNKNNLSFFFSANRIWGQVYNRVRR